MTTLEAQMQVDYGIFLLKKYLEKLEKPTSPIDAAIDMACGRNGIKEIRDDAIEVLESIVEAKTFLGYDCEREQEMKNKIRQLGGQDHKVFRK